MKLDIKKTNIKYNNYSGLPFEMQLLNGYRVRPESLETFETSYASSKVKNEKDAIRNIRFPTLASDTSLNQKKKNK